jgi:hypothetical protein
VGNTTGALAGQMSVGGLDAFIRKFDLSGAELWTRQFGSASLDDATGVAADGNGAAYVVGYAAGALPGQTPVGEDDVFIRKYYGNGAELWTRQFGTPTEENPKGVAADTTGVYVVGYTVGVFQGQPNRGTGTDAFIRYHDAAGGERWTRQIGGSGAEVASGVALNGGLATVVGTTTTANPSGFIYKYDRTGTLISADQSPGSVSTVVVDGGAVYVVGQTGGTLPGQTGADAGGVDVFIRKSKAAVEVLWARQTGTPADETPTGLALDGNGRIYVVGYSSDNSAWPGGGQGFVQMYDAGGDVRIDDFQGGTGNNFARAVAVDDTWGGAYVVGHTEAPWLDRQARVAQTRLSATICRTGLDPPNSLGLQVTIWRLA